MPWSLNDINDFEHLCTTILILKKRPKIPNNISNDKITQYLLNIINLCWESEMHLRPTINEILISIQLNLEKIE